MHQCLICLDTTHLPIELHFQCKKENMLHCNSFHRICLVCYLHNNHIHQCFFCKQEICKELKFSFDFSSMNSDISIYSCKLCNKFKGNHLDYYHHFMKHHIFHCTFCNSYFLKEYEQRHRNECQAKNFVSCSQCSLLIHRKKYISHIKTHLDESHAKIKIYKELIRNEREQQDKHLNQLLSMDDNEIQEDVHRFLR